MNAIGGVFMTEINFSEIRPQIRFSDFQILNSGFALNNVHGRDVRMIYIFSGTMCIDMDGVSYTATRGCLALFPSSVCYSLRNETTEAANTLSIDFSYLSSENTVKTPLPWIPHRIWKESDAIDPVRLTNAPEFNGPLFLDSMQMLEPYFRELSNEHKSPRILQDALRASLMQSVLLLIWRRLLSGNAKRPRSLVDDVIDYVHQNYTTHLTNEEIGRHFNYHPNYINRIIRQRTGKSLHQYVLSCRVSHALELLRTTDISVTEVAEKVGFSSVKHFSQTFKATYGYSPMHFK